MRVKLPRSVVNARRTPRRGRHGAGDAPAARAAVPPPPPPLRPVHPATPGERERCAGGPQDRALFICRCGSAFQAPVTASVRCPHCGDAHAW